MKLVQTSLALAGLLLGVVAIPAQADESNRAQALAQECKSDRRACEEYLLGVWDAVLVYGNMAKAPLFCPTRAPTGDELLAAFEKWVAENPDKMELARATGAMLALKHAYPCGQG